MELNPILEPRLRSPEDLQPSPFKYVELNDYTKYNCDPGILSYALFIECHYTLMVCSRLATMNP